MTITVYNSIAMLLGVAVLISLGIAAVSFVFMFVRWKTPKRRGHVIRLVASLAAILSFVGVQQALLWLVLLPSLGRQQMAQINAAREAKLVESSLVMVGDNVPNFSLTTTDGDQLSLPSDGKTVLVNFFATWCGPCKLELPHIERIWSDHQHDDRFRLVVIGREETEDTVRSFRDQNGFTFPMAADPNREIYSLFAKDTIPRTLIVSPDGRIVYCKAGFYQDDLSELTAVLQQQLGSGDFQR